MLAAAGELPKASGSMLRASLGLGQASRPVLSAPASPLGAARALLGEASAMPKAPALVLRASRTMLQAPRPVLRAPAPELGVPCAMVEAATPMPKAPVLVLEGFGFDALSFNAGASCFAVDGFGISVLFGSRPNVAQLHAGFN